MNTLQGIPFSMILLLAAASVLLYLGFRGYRQLLLPIVVLKADGQDRQKTLRRIELLAWAIYVAVGIYFSLKVSLVITLALLALVSLAFFDFWRNFFAGIVLKFGDNFQLGDFITINGYSGTVAGFGNRTLKIVTTAGEEILSPYSLVKHEIKIEQKQLPKTLFKTLEIENLPPEKKDWHQALTAAIYANPWIIISNPVEVAVQDNRAVLRFSVLDPVFFERARRRLLADVGL